MEVKLTHVIFLSLCFRIFLLLIILKEDNLPMCPPKNENSLVHSLKPVTKRVVLIFINGLGSNFLKSNSTPFIREKLNEGSFGTALVENLQTNHGGMKAVLSGRKNLNFPYSWIMRNEKTILDYVECKCGMGHFPKDLSLNCKASDDNFTINLNKVMSKKSNQSCLLVINNDFDPVTVGDYKTKLREVDDQIRLFTILINSFYEDDETTYIVTSARGTPVGSSLEVDAPVVTWGKSIARNSDATVLKQQDLAAMLCALLGVRFPTGLDGVIPMNLLKIPDDYVYQLSLYTIRHYENVLGAKYFNMIQSSHLEKRQIFTRLNSVISRLKEVNFKRSLLNSIIVLLLLTIWGVLLTSACFAGHSLFFINFKHLFSLLTVVSVILIYAPHNWMLRITSAVLVYWLWQNWRIIFTAFQDNFFLLSGVVTSIFAAFIFVRYIGNHFLLLFLCTPVVLWPVFSGFFKRLNRFVLVSRILSGFLLGVLPFKRIFSEKEEPRLVAFISFVFVINFYLLFCIFKRQICAQVKVTFLMICLTTTHVFLLHKADKWPRDGFSVALLAFSLLSACETFGTILERLFKVYLSVLIPVLMLNIKEECIFYFAMVFHSFTWIFVEYHTNKYSKLQYNPSVFSVEPKYGDKSSRFSPRDMRVVLFYVIYSYLGYFAIGHAPDLVSFDFYVLPNFVYKYPIVISYFLAIFKFFLPFFLTTTTLVAFCGVQEKSTSPVMVMSLWVSDVIGCCFIFFSQFLNRALFFEFPINYSYFIILQCATICAILSYFIGEYLLFAPEKLFTGILRGNIRQEKIAS